MDLLRVLKEIKRQEEERPETATTGIYPSALREQIIRDAFAKERRRVKRCKIMCVLAEIFIMLIFLASAISVFI